MDLDNARTDQGLGNTCRLDQVRATKTMDQDTLQMTVSVDALQSVVEVVLARQS